MTLKEREQLYNAIKKVIYEKCLIKDCKSYEKFIRDLSRFLRI